MQGERWRSRAPGGDGREPAARGGTDRLLQNAGAYAESFAGSDLPAAPSKRVAILACLDARLIPSRVLRLDEGEAHVTRNAGGVITG